MATAKEGGEGPPEPPRGAEALTEPLPPPAAAALSTRRSRAASCVLRRGSLSVCEKKEIDRNQAREGAQPSAPAATWEKQPRAKAPGGACAAEPREGRAVSAAGRERLGLPSAGSDRRCCCRGERRLRLRAAGSVARLRQSRCAASGRRERRAGRAAGSGAALGPGGGRGGGERSLGGQRAGSLPLGAGLGHREGTGRVLAGRWGRRESAPGRRDRHRTAPWCPAPAPSAHGPAAVPALPCPAPGAPLSERLRTAAAAPQEPRVSARHTFPAHTAEGLGLGAAREGRTKREDEECLWASVGVSLKRAASHRSTDCSYRRKTRNPRYSHSVHRSVTCLDRKAQEGGETSAQARLPTGKDPWDKTYNSNRGDRSAD